MALVTGRGSSGAGALPPAGAAPRMTARRWAAAGAVLAALLLVASWFLVLAPQRAEAADLRDQAVTAEDGNTALEARVAVLKRQYADLPQTQAQLDLLRQALPEDAALPALVRQVRAAALSSGTSLTSVVPSTPAAVATATPSPAASPAASASADASASAASTGGAATGATDAAATSTTATTAATPSAASALVAVPFTTTVTGGYAACEAFLHELQRGQRLVAVTSVTLATADGSSSGSPAGDLSMTVVATAFALPSTGATGAAGAAGTGATGATGAAGTAGAAGAAGTTTN